MDVLHSELRYHSYMDTGRDPVVTQFHDEIPKLLVFAMP